MRPSHEATWAARSVQSTRGPRPAPSTMTMLQKKRVDTIKRVRLAHMRSSSDHGSSCNARAMALHRSGRETAPSRCCAYLFVALVLEGVRFKHSVCVVGQIVHQWLRQLASLPCMHDGRIYARLEWCL